MNFKPFKALQSMLGAFLIFCSLATATLQAEVNPSSSYVLNEGDVLSIYVYGEDDLTFNEIRVGDFGFISYPFLGDISVAGMTLREVEAALVDGLRPDYLVDPKITVSIVEYRPFFINGEISKPGSYQFQPGMSLHQAVSLAGGLTERASTSKIYVVHDGGSESVKVDLSYQVKPGDTVTIKQSFF